MRAVSVSRSRRRLYQDNPWALVECDDGKSQNLEIARRLVFEPSPLRVPYRLGSLPEGYLGALGE
ncbi:MAG: hypothetical protein QOF52_57 [Propionibacteriaceae bacterium]|jgi:hypothetical protein|nr:hypothetical protein [Propionibacteriaceae bacterium]MDX6320199.1 hypothetical protein [Propionibacteriaceae bacterium]